MNSLAAASFLAFGALLVLFGSNATEIIESLRLGYKEYGLVASMLSLGLGVGILSSGPLVDRLPRRPIFVAACALVIAATFSLGPKTLFHGLLAASFFIGLGAGFYETLLNAVIVEQSGVKASRRLLLIHSAATVGAALTPFLIGTLRKPLDLEWFDSFHAAGAMHLFLILGVPLLSEKKLHDQPAENSQTHTKSPTHSIGPSKSGRRLLAAICLVTFAYVGTESAYTFFIADHARVNLGLEPARATRIVGFFWAGLLAGRLGIGLSSREPSALATSSLALAASLLSVIFFAFGHLEGFVPPEFAVALTGLLLGSVFPIMIGLAGTALPKSAGTAVGLAGGLGSLGGFLIPWWTGIAAESIGLGPGLATLTGWLLLLAAAAYLVHVYQVRLFPGRDSPH